MGGAGGGEGVKRGGNGEDRRRAVLCSEPFLRAASWSPSWLYASPAPLCLSSVCSGPGFVCSKGHLFLIPIKTLYEQQWPLGRKRCLCVEAQRAKIPELTKASAGKMILKSCKGTLNESMNL